MHHRATVFLILAGMIFSLPAHALTANDPLFNLQWYLHTIEAPSAWDVSTGSRQVVVAVLDNGVDLDHPDLRDNIWRNTGESPGDGVDNDQNGFVDDVTGWNFVEGNANPNPVVGANTNSLLISHGTAVAGVIAAVGNNHEGISGVAMRTQIMPLRILNSEGTSNDLEPVLEAMRYAVRNGADIINLSFVAEFEDADNGSIAALSEVIKLARDAGVIVVAAIGNSASGGIDTDTHPLYPVCINGPAGENWVLGVAALDRRSQKASFSNYGSLCVDLAAPGEEIVSTQFSDPSLRGSRAYTDPAFPLAGSSLAAPIVSGAAALVRAVAPRLSREEVIDVLLKSAVPLDDVQPQFRGQLGRGRVNVAAAVTLARSRASRTLRPTLAVSGEEGAPWVWLFNDPGTLISGFLAYEETFRGGVRLAASDLDGDALKEVITVPGPGRPVEVGIFTESGKAVRTFPAFDHAAGASVAAGDLDGDGSVEIIVASGKGVAPLVRVFDTSGVLRAEFLAYGSTFLGGVEVAVGNTDGLPGDEIVTGVRSGGGPHIRIFDGRGNLMGQFFAFEETYRNGVRLALGDVGGSINSEILVSRGGGETARIHELRADGSSWNTILAFAEDQDGPLAIASRSSTTYTSEIFVAGGKREAFPMVHGLTPIGALISAFPVPRELGVVLHIATL